MAELKTYEGNGHSATIHDPENITKDECLALARCGAEVWNNWRQEFPAELYDSGHINNRANFSHHSFLNQTINFQFFNFGDGADFTGAAFQDLVNFKLAIFGHHANFRGAMFGRGSILAHVKFGDQANFRGAQFWSETDFSATVFGYGVSFLGAQFGEGTNFRGARFLGHTNFEAKYWEAIEHYYTERGFSQIKAKAKEAGLAPDRFGAIHFDGAKFGGYVSFSGRKFYGATSFNTLKNYLKPTAAESYAIRHFPGYFASEDQAIPKGEVVSFTSAPEFHNCELHKDTSFDDAVFPPASGDERAARAYRTLKLAFSKQQAIREEQRFFKLEMEEEAARESGHKRWLYRLYSATSDFGFSVWRPMGWLLLTFMICVVLYAWQAGLRFNFQAPTHTAVLLHFTLANALPGFEKLAEPAALQLFGEFKDSAGNAVKGVPHYQVATVITLLVQKALSLLFLFLAGLALRNLFKMK